MADRAFGAVFVVRLQAGGADFLLPLKLVQQGLQGGLLRQGEVPGGELARGGEQA